MNARLVDTPRYVLLDGKQRIGPRLLASHSGPECAAIYAFTDKQPYDEFCANSPLALTPYPLVKGYLRDQLAQAGDTVQLVIVDAASPQETHLDATTMSAILEAQEKQNSNVTVSFELMLDQATQAYRVEQASSDFDTASSPATETQTRKQETP